MNFDYFHEGTDGKGTRAYRGPDRHHGFPALEAIRKRGPDFFVATGDNVYYDPHDASRPLAMTREEMRRRWREQFVQPRFVSLFADVPTYWQKDDHDYRYNDCDTTGDLEPSDELGKSVFREQIPVVDPREPDAVTYRTHRISRLLQIWLVEGRDHRSPNAMADGPEKSLRGNEQLSWLKRTLLQSDATFRILISPTPLIGPDSAHKRDNHTNPRGFRHEGEAFLAWLSSKGLPAGHFSIVCGDRHWQYHSMHPGGVEEFSCGALVDANAVVGVHPGAPGSTDSDARITRYYTQKEPSGGFLEVSVRPGAGEVTASSDFSFFDENGFLQYRHRKFAGVGRK